MVKDCHSLLPYLLADKHCVPTNYLDTSQSSYVPKSPVGLKERSLPKSERMVRDARRKTLTYLMFFHHILTCYAQLVDERKSE